MRIATICTTSLCAGLLLAGSGGAESGRCVSTKVSVRIDGERVCLAAGQSCTTRERTAYARSGLRCLAGRLRFDWRPLQRPFRRSPLPPGTACPVSQTAAVRFGPGPAYPSLNPTAGQALLTLVWKTTEPPYEGWAGTKLLWSVPNYAGAVLVRGRQLDGDTTVGFDLGPQWSRQVHPDLRLVGPINGLRPAATFVRTPGCFAYQVDTLRASYQLVVEARYLNP